MKKLSYFLLFILLLSFTYGAVKTDSQKLDDITKKLEDMNYKLPNSYINVHGTEYQIGDDIKVWLQLLNSTYKSISNGVCYMSVYNPNNTILYDNTKMNNLMSNGIYYYDINNFNLDKGVYPVIAECFYTTQEQFKYPNNYFLTIGTTTNNDLTRLYVIDNNNFKFKETLSGLNRRIDVGYNITNTSQCTNISQDLLKDITINVVAKFDSIILDNVYISIYNFTSDTFMTLPNFIPEGNFFTTVTNTILTNNITKSGLYKSPFGSIVRFSDIGIVDGADSELEIDQFYISCDSLSNGQWYEIKGSSEIHITDINDNLNITDEILFNFTQSNNDILSAINQSKNEINSNIDNLTFLNITVQNNVSINITIDLNNISNQLQNITNNQEQAESDYNMIAYILLFILGVILLIYNSVAQTKIGFLYLVNILIFLITTVLFFNVQIFITIISVFFVFLLGYEYSIL